MLTEGDPHLVVAFPLGESRGTRQMMRIAAAAGVGVEEIDAASRTTLTDTGALYDLAAIARRAQAAGRDAGPVAAPALAQTEGRRLQLQHGKGGSGDERDHRQRQPLPALPAKVHDAEDTMKIVATDGLAFRPKGARLTAGGRPGVQAPPARPRSAAGGGKSAADRGGVRPQRSSSR